MESDNFKPGLDIRSQKSEVMSGPVIGCQINIVALLIAGEYYATAVSDYLQ